MMTNLVSKSPEEKQKCQFDQPYGDPVDYHSEDLSSLDSLVDELEFNARGLETEINWDRRIQVLCSSLPSSDVGQKEDVS